jgi:TPR repeat protein
VLISNKVKQIKTLLSLILLSFNLTANAMEPTLNERFKAAVVIEATDIYAAFPLYQDLANKGYTEAKVRLAALLSAGLGDKSTREEKFQKSINLLHEAANEGSIKAYYGLFVMYYDSDEPNAELGMSWLTKAAEAGEPRGQNQLGYLYDKGILVNQDSEKAIYWYKEAIKNNSNNARYNLANIYLDGLNDTQQKVTEAISLYLSAAEQGDDDAKVALGSIYYDDKYGLKEGVKSFNWLNDAAQNGNTYGQAGVANCYRYGIGTDIDYKKALYWYKHTASSTNNPISRYRLAEMHMLGLGTEINLSKAREIFLALSQEGYADGTTGVEQVDELIEESKP